MNEPHIPHVDHAAAVGRAFERDHEFRILEGLCAFGGRLAGSAAEVDSRHWLADYVRREAGLRFDTAGFSYAAWEGASAHLAVDGREVPAALLVGTPPTRADGLVAPLVDVGRGTPEDFDLAGDAVGGAIVLVRHEYMFTRSTVHRRIKYAEAIRRGAAGFVIGAHLPGVATIGGAVSAADDEAIPAVGVGYETAERLAAAAAAGNAKVRLAVEAARGGTARADNLVLDLPGRGDGLVVLSAHIDGHVPAESALDNATGVAAATAAAIALAPSMAQAGRGLRLCIFTAEEWGLTGSRVYLDEMDADERRRLQCNVNLDSVAGDPHLTALTSGFADFGTALQSTLRPSGLSLATYLPIMNNSDHANFAAHGIPAARIVAGFDRPGSNMTYVLTSADTRDKAAASELKAATLATTRLVAELAAAAAPA